MTLYEFREEYPEYDDMPDKVVRKLLKDAGTEVEPDDDELILPTLQSIEAAVRGIRLPAEQDNSEMLARLGEIRVGLKAVEAAVKGLKLSTEAPIVNVPAPVVTVQGSKEALPRAPTEWTFDVVRNRDGFITEVKARA